MGSGAPLTSDIDEVVEQGGRDTPMSVAVVGDHGHRLLIDAADGAGDRDAIAVVA